MLLTFDAEQKAIDAQKQIWVNYIKFIFPDNKDVIGTGILEYSSLDELNNSEVASLKIYGTKENIINKATGLTIKYTDIQKIYNQDKWYFLKPENQFMTNVVEYQEEEFNPEWVDPLASKLN